MRSNLKKSACGVMVAVAALFAVSATPASATNSTGCDGRNDFLQFNTNPNGLGRSLCFANAGNIAVNIGNVYSFSSGNNKVTVDYEFDGRYYYTNLEKWQTQDFGSITVRVYEIRVY